MRKLKWIFMALLLTACHEDKKIMPVSGKVELVFETDIDSVPLVLYTAKYLSPLNDTFQVQQFKFFVHFRILSNATSAYKKDNSYNLMYYESEGTKTNIVFDDVPAGEYGTLKFDIGVDSANNHSIDQLGELAPGSGMTWDWNTGYKFLLLEGTYSNTLRTGPLVVHVAEDKNYKAISLALPSTLKVEANKISTIKIRVNINEMFRNPHSINFDNVSGAAVDRIAQNYQEGMFSIKQIVNP